MWFKCQKGANLLRAIYVCQDQNVPKLVFGLCSNPKLDAEVANLPAFLKFGRTEKQSVVTPWWSL